MVALTVWGSACYRLKDRDAHIGWTASLRARRQKLVVQNRRFTLLAKRGERPNPASRVLGLAAWELPALWRAGFGYEPLPAEIFRDREASAGTCHRAAGWTPPGMTKGYSRSRQTADYYVPNGRPKALRVRPLRPDACGALRAAELPPECRRGADSDAYGVLPLPEPLVGSLRDALCGARDPRGSNRETRSIPCPKETSFFRLLGKTAPAELQDTLLKCLDSLLGPGAGPEAVIIDGKALRCSRGVQLVSAFSAETGR